MSFKTIKEGQPLTPDSLNRFVANGAATWVASTTFSGTSTYNIDNIIAYVNASAPRWTRVVISNLVCAGATALFIRAIDSIGTVVMTNNYQIGYYGCNSAGSTTSNFAIPTSVWNIGEIGGVPANYTLDFYHNGSNNHGISMIGTAQGGSVSGNSPTVVMMGGWCNYNTRPIRGLNLTSFAAVNFSGKIDVYQYRRM